MASIKSLNVDISVLQQRQKQAIQDRLETEQSTVDLKKKLDNTEGEYHEECDELQKLVDIAAADLDELKKIHRGELEKEQTDVRKLERSVASMVSFATD